MKKVLSLILVFVFLFCFTSCSFFNRFKGDMSKIDFDEDHNLLYSGNTYYRTDDRFTVWTDEDVVEIGWHSQFPFFPDMHYYVFNDENPLFIFCANGKSSVYFSLFFRSDYDLYGALYTVNNTDIEIVLNSAILPSDVNASAIKYEYSQQFHMRLKDDSRIRVEFSGPYKHGDNWYFLRSDNAWLLSDHFVTMLINNGIINE